MKTASQRTTKNMQRKKIELPENKLCRLAYSCVNTQYALCSDISIRLGVSTSYNYMTFNM